MSVSGSIFLAAMICASAFAQSGVREVPVLVTNTFGLPLRSYSVEIRDRDGRSQKLDSPKSIRLSPGRLEITVRASLHWSAEFELEVSPDLSILMVGLTQPTGASITGDTSGVEAVAVVSTGVANDSSLRVLRIVGVYSTYRRDIIVDKQDGDVSISELPFGVYRAFLFSNGRLAREYDLLNKEFEPIVFREIGGPR